MIDHNQPFKSFSNDHKDESQRTW